MVDLPPLLASISVFLATGLLITSALFLNDWRKPHSKCDYDLEFCKIFKFYVIGASFGIVASILQLLSSILGFYQKWKLWCWIHALVFILAIIAFSLPMEKDADKMKWHFGDNSVRHKAKAFLALAGADFIYVFLAIGFIYFKTKI